MSSQSNWHPYQSPTGRPSSRAAHLNPMPRRASDASAMGYSSSQSLYAMRPDTSSELSNAMGGTQSGTLRASPNSGSGGSGSPDEGQFDMSDINWNPNQPMPYQPHEYPDHSGSMPPHNPLTNPSGAPYMYQTPYQTPYDSSGREPLPTPPPHFAQSSYPASRPMLPNRGMAASPEPPYDVAISGRRSRPSRPGTMNLGDEEVSRLRRKVNELQSINDSLSQRVDELDPQHPSGSKTSSRRINTPGGLPTPVTPGFSGTPAPTQSFLASWRARTEARVRLYCSLNRAGNALCSWHDSRRERRAFPPRLAPPGTLNCGCTYDEALFEETLARHGVGSYRPGGDTVRMDPALRNPLLRLLQTRYGYRDGDFERDPVSGGWIGNEGPALWEQRAIAGLSGSRRRGSGAGDRSS